MRKVSVYWGYQNMECKIICLVVKGWILKLSKYAGTCIMIFVRTEKCFSISRLSKYTIYIFYMVVQGLNVKSLSKYAV